MLDALKHLIMRKKSKTVSGSSDCWGSPHAARSHVIFLTLSRIHRMYSKDFGGLFKLQSLQLLFAFSALLLSVCLSCATAASCMLLPTSPWFTSVHPPSHHPPKALRSDTLASLPDMCKTWSGGRDPFITTWHVEQHHCGVMRLQPSCQILTHSVVANKDIFKHLHMSYISAFVCLSGKILNYLLVCEWLVWGYFSVCLQF